MSDQIDPVPGVARGSKLAPVTPSDTVVQANRFVALHNNTATGGTVAITDQEDVAVTLYLAPGQVLACRPRLIKTSGTTVATIVGFKQ